MLITTRAILLRTIPHGERTLVVRVLTEALGLRALVVRKGGRSAPHQALLVPMNRLELVLDERDDRELRILREWRMEKPYLRATSDPVRATVLLFLQELHARVLREESADERLFRFVHQALDRLDECEDLRVFPHVHLLQLAAHLGFRPEPPEAKVDRFDLREGLFLHGDAGHADQLLPPHSQWLAELLALSVGDPCPDGIPAEVRRELLDSLLRYYRMHVPDLIELRSPTVLRQVLG